MSDVMDCSGNQNLETKRDRKVVNSSCLIKRKLIKVVSQDDGQMSNSDYSIRVMQWNMLAQGLCRYGDRFVLCPDEALDWSVRRDLILEECFTYAPDILCLQEVDDFNFLQQNLRSAGYKGSFFPKPNSPCLYTKDSRGPDGCAIFWNEKRLSLSSINNFVLQTHEGRNTNQVAIICKFEFKCDKTDAMRHEICVATTHLKSKVSYHKLRFQQGSYLESCLRHQCHGSPLIICGDFNSEPHEQVIDVFKSSSLGLRSSYSLLSETGAEPPFTTWKVRGKHDGNVEYCHTIDYLFFTPEYFSCSQLVQLPTGEEIGESRLPSHSYPSDHLSLIGDFQLKKV